MKHWNERGTGLLLCLCIAIPCWMLGRALPVIGAILAGMAIALLVRDKGRAQAGIAYTSKTILQYAVILLGFGLNLSEVAKVGVQSLPIILSTITTSLVVSFLLHRLLHIPSNISTLVGGRPRLRHRGRRPGHRRGRRGDRPVHLGHLPVQCGGRPPVPHPGRPAGSGKRGLRTLCRHGGE